MSDPQAYCPFCKRSHDAPEFIETSKAANKRIAELEVAIAGYLSAASNANLMWLSDALEKTQAKLQEKDDE